MTIKSPEDMVVRDYAAIVWRVLMSKNVKKVVRDQVDYTDAPSSMRQANSTQKVTGDWRVFFM